jgi:nucleoside 2-deoxyribosyltransferase
MFMKKKIYLAGFDVFCPDAKAVLKQKKILCEQYGFKGLAPLDNEVDLLQSKASIRKAIYEANIALIEEADILCVNLNDFRHGEPDAGSVFEIGYGAALGKSVYIYVDGAESMLEKTKANDSACSYKDGIWFDGNGLIIEDFDGMFNLMITESSTITNGTLEDVLKKLSEEVR